MIVGNSTVITGLVARGEFMIISLSAARAKDIDTSHPMPQQDYDNHDE